MKTVLVVEDDLPLQRALSDACKREGHNCIVASDGDEALSLALEKKPDLILLDILLPKRDGFAVLKELRRDSWGVSVRVIVLTNLSANDGERVKSAVDTYPEYYLVKSDWPIGEIMKKISEVWQD